MSCAWILVLVVPALKNEVVAQLYTSYPTSYNTLHVILRHVPAFKIFGMILSIVNGIN